MSFLDKLWEKLTKFQEWCDKQWIRFKKWWKENWKTVLTAVIILAVLAVVIWAIWFLFFSASAPAAAAIKATIAKTSVAKTSPAVIKSLPAVSSTACNLPARITEDEIRISKLFQSFDFPEFLHYFSMAVEMEKSSPPIRLNLPIPPKSSLPSFDSSSNNIMRVVGETATKTQTVASSSLFENILPSLKNTTSEGRRVYDFSAEIEGIKINELMIDPHYEEKHGSYINDGKIFSIVKEFLKTKAYWPSRNLRSGAWRFFESDVFYEGKNYRLVFCLEDNKNYLGIRHCRYEKKKNK